MKIAVCLPTGETVTTNFAFSLLTFMTTPRDHVLKIYNVRTGPIQDARRILVGEALSWGCDAVFFIDSDLVFPSDGLDRLVEHDLDIVGATFGNRRPPYGAGLEVPLSPMEPDVTGLREMAWMSVGFCLIRRRVFEDVPAPWFHLRWDGERFIGEDYTFCEGARAAGYSVWCDLDLSRELGHEGTYIAPWMHSPQDQVQSP